MRRPDSFMTPVRLAHVALTAALVALAAGCGAYDAVRPRGDLAATYGLATIDGAPLPQWYGWSSPASGHSELLADTVTLLPDGRVRHVQRRRHTPGYNECPGPACTPTEGTGEEGGTWGARGADVEIRFENNQPDRGVLRGRISATDGTLVLVDSAAWLRPGTYVYRR
jgi:hypothetical protein